MSEIISAINERKFLSMKPATSKMIENAEDTLKLKFNIEYVEYVMNYGAISYFGHELTGVCDNNNFDVVKVTLLYRNEMKNVKNEWYVIEEVGFDDIVIWQSTKGYIYKTKPNCNSIKICNSLAEYIKKY